MSGTGISSILTRLNASRLYWIQSIVDLGRGWHPCGQVASRAGKHYRQGTNYLYELGARFPGMVQVDRAKDMVRLPDGVFEETKRSLPGAIEAAKAKHPRRSASSP